jgi:hypothetical protein
MPCLFLAVVAQLVEHKLPKQLPTDVPVPATSTPGHFATSIQNKHHSFHFDNSRMSVLLLRCV